MEKVLVVDDDKDILYLIKEILEDEDYEVITSDNSIDAIDKLKLNPNIILLDVMMPGCDGFELCMMIRDIIDVPIIFITAKTAEEDIIKGLAIGGDDYIIKPFSIKQLKARVSAHLRRDRRKNNDESKNYLRVKDIKVDLKQREVIYFDNNINLTKREFDILEILILNPNQVFSKENIYEKVWGYEAEGDSSTIAEHIKKIRSKFSNVCTEFDNIHTVWGVGYKWKNL